MTKIYISHPYSGNEEANLRHANLVRAALKRAYPTICCINPLGMFGDKETGYVTALSDAMELLSACDAAIFCDGWEDSCGCRAEMAFCKQQGIKIRSLSEYITKREYT